MERTENNKKRRSKERDHHDHEKKKKKKNLKNEKKQVECRSTIVIDHHTRYNYDSNKNDGRPRSKLDKNDLNYHHRQDCKVQDDENFNYHVGASSSSSSSSASVVNNIDGEKGIFDFPWLKDESEMFSLEEEIPAMIFQQQTAADHNPYRHLLYFDHHHYDYCYYYSGTTTTSKINDYIKSDNKSDCALEFDTQDYYIWNSVLDQPLI